jgi:hypothetical protein
MRVRFCAGVAYLIHILEQHVDSAKSPGQAMKSQQARLSGLLFVEFSLLFSLVIW